jgi:hypothetical protein
MQIPREQRDRQTIMQSPANLQGPALMAGMPAVFRLYTPVIGTE